MRRPRSKLEVSTFPFLAVLLCAMGALLLLLFIMDRRAKIAAQHTASEAIAERQKRTQAEEDARQAEWLKAKDLLHQSLAEQFAQVSENSKNVQQDLDDINKKLAVVQNHHFDLKDKATRESTQIAALQTQVTSQRANLKDVELKDRKAKAELLDAARELAELERAFQQLRRLKENEKQVYSVVPYRGKRGEARSPIYVECLRNGVVFHPEKKLIEGWDFTPESLKAEVERRTGALHAEKSAKEKSRTIAEERRGPYVLFLVRPAGIESYYKAQSGLKGYDLDFGYELVDEDWVLDFNGDPNARPAPPIPFAKSGEVRKPVQPLLNGIRSEGSGGAGSSVAATEGAKSGGNGGPALNRGANPGLGRVGGAPVGSGLFPNGANAGSVGSPVVGGGFGPGYPRIESGPPPLGVSNAGQGSGPMPPPSGGISVAPPMLGNPSYSGERRGPAKEPSFVPIAKLPRPGPVVSSEGNPLAKPNANSPPGNGGAGLTPIGLPLPGQNVGGKTMGSANPGATAAPPAGTPNTGQNEGKPGGGSSNSGSGGDADGSPSRGKPLPSSPTFGMENAKKPAPPPAVSRMFGNRDFVITIDCYTDHATVFPSGLQYRWNGPNANANDEALVKTVSNLIARRQASVRQGEPPYRPVIRFQVSEDGLRTFLRIYPLLAPLNVEMTRENVRD